MLSRKSVAIVLPIYTKNITPEESISLKLLEMYLGKYDRFFLAPDNLTSGSINRKGYKVVRFGRSFFASRSGYNKLLLQEGFYKAFNNYNYILIYQLDALVFSDQLEKWVNSGYDYIAAPWFKPVIAALSNKRNSPISGGNGGFSLRNVSKSLKVLENVRVLTKRRTANPLIARLWFLLAVLTGNSYKIWLNAPADNYPFNEDGFWSLEAPKYLPSYKVAPFNTALKFAFERFPRKCYELNNGKLPFGAHAWQKYDRKFWLYYLGKGISKT